MNLKGWMFFRLLPHVGVDPVTGALEPFLQEGLRFGTHEKVNGQWVASQRTVTLLPVRPGSRITATQDPAVAAVLRGGSKWVECDPPRFLRPRRPHR